MDHDHHHEGPHPSRYGRGKIAFVVMLAIAAFFLILEHRAHLVGILPYLLILACPLMHLFHHSGHGGHAAHDHEQRRESAESDLKEHRS
ncbi:hypothetical protein GCM10028796_05110 [Ramlibacter monticola]|uniref:DUF2933 domain-containing protein n=1 Tax=Ramlibacter monticola TaxID=1926872 RepID=A0A936YZX8_9BURK|nr:DUF2933 domain-containing protein [Ramlibacter monticola]MBL0391211.1 DUF2933 domain-containing protein [Ramlibacter monticola]